MRYIVQMRRGTAQQWTDSQIVPEAGEIVIELDEEHHLHKLKIGDGINYYDDLKYLMAGDEIVTQVLTQVKPRVVTITLYESEWKIPDYHDTDNPNYYVQEIKLDNITTYSRLDLQPDADLFAEFKDLGVMFVTKNDEQSRLWVYSVGAKPLKDYTMQATIVETGVDSEDGGVSITGTPVGMPTLQPDWTQIDDTKGDYIKNKPTVDQDYNAESTNAQSGVAVAQAFAPVLEDMILMTEEIDALQHDVEDLISATEDLETIRTNIQANASELETAKNNIQSNADRLDSLIRYGKEEDLPEKLPTGTLYIVYEEE